MASTSLLENTVRHTPPEGTVTVAAKVDGRSVTVTVTDTGEGIAPEPLPHLGERFYRVDAARAAARAAPVWGWRSAGASSRRTEAG